MNTEEDILKNVGNQLMMAIDFSLVFFFISSIVLLPTFLKIYIFYVFSGKKRNSYRFETNEGGVQYHRMFIFGWTVPLMELCRNAVVQQCIINIYNCQVYKCFLMRYV